MPLLVKCYDNKKVKSLIGLTIYQLVGPRGGEPTKEVQEVGYQVFV